MGSVRRLLQHGTRDPNDKSNTYLGLQRPILLAMPPPSAPRTARAPKKMCPCCHRKLHPETVSRHLRGIAPGLYRASEQVELQDREDGWSILADARPVKRTRYAGGQREAVGQERQSGGGSSGATQQGACIVWL